MIAERMIAIANDATYIPQTAIQAMRLEFAVRGILEIDMPRSLAVRCEVGSLVVTWSDEASIEAGYEIERQTGDGPWQVVARFDMADVERFEDTGASCGETPEPVYSYRVAAFSTFGLANADTLRAFSVEVMYPPSSSQNQSRVSRLVVLEEVQSEEAAKFDTELRAVYPNPFNPVTTISYALKEEDHARLVVYDVLGRKVAVLVDSYQAAGEHTIAFDAARLPSGTYFVFMETSAYRRNRMMMLAK